MTHYAALDVSLRSVHVCVIDTDGKIKAEAKLPSEVEDIRAYLDELGLEITAVGFEAGTLTQYLSYGLTAAGYEVICMEARQVKAALSAMRNKTDKHDARGIAQILRSGWFSGNSFSIVCQFPCQLSIRTTTVSGLTPSYFIASAPASLCKSASNAAMSATSIVRPTLLGASGFTKVRMFSATPANTSCLFGEASQ